MGGIKLSSESSVVSSSASEKGYTSSSSGGGGVLLPGDSFCRSLQTLPQPVNVNAINYDHIIKPSTSIKSMRPTYLIIPGGSGPPYYQLFLPMEIHMPPPPFPGTPPPQPVKKDTNFPVSLITSELRAFEQALFNPKEFRQRNPRWTLTRKYNRILNIVQSVRNTYGRMHMSLKNQRGSGEKHSGMHIAMLQGEITRLKKELILAVVIQKEFERYMAMPQSKRQRSAK